MPTQAVRVPVTEQVDDAAEAFVYGYPLVYNAHESAAFVAGGSSFPMQAPYNDFGHARKLAGPELKFVSPNNDTLYSVAICDVRRGPLVLHVPNTGGRYYVLQLVDAWTNNFAYVGRRATGTDEAEFLLAERGYEGPVRDGMRVIHAPTGVFAIVGRIQVDGEADLPAVHALQDEFTLTPLSGADAAVGEPVQGIPEPDPRVGEELAWWEQLRVALQAFPPPEADAPFLEICEQFGLLEPHSPYVDPDPDLASVLSKGAKAGQAKIDELMKEMHATPEGWQLVLHVFDYNLDHFELGTIDAPQWKIPDRKTAYVERAVAARAGLWGNHGYEAEYALVWVDADGDQLDGSHRYELRLETPPPVDAFWSFTMYDVPDFYLVANPIDRYSIGDRTPGLKTGGDGSVTIYLQKDSPGPEKESNWLPTPPGIFRPALRMYQPRKELIDGTYVLPAITKVD